MSKLEQFSASYDAAQGRLVLRIRGNDDAEFRLWITRRYLALLWPLLMKMADEFSARKTTTPQTRNTLAELARGEAVNNADFGSAYRNGSTYPLGEEPILLGRVTVKPLQGSSQTLTLLPQEGQGINLDLDEKLVHILARLLQQAAVAAEWALSLDNRPGTGATPAPLHAGGPRMLH